MPFPRDSNMYEYVANTAEMERFQRQYFQLLDVGRLSFPSDLVRPESQEHIFHTLFDTEKLNHPPPQKYQIGVLKQLLARIEEGITDPEENEVSDLLLTSLTDLLTSPQPSQLEAAQQKSYVSYSVPAVLSDGLVRTVTTYESRNVLASTGTTGFRTWEAALHLAYYLSSSEGRQVVKGKNVLELGAGTGLVSALCARHLEAKRVLATDGDVSVVEEINTTIFLNGLAGHDRIEGSVYKWGHALIDGSLTFHDEQIPFDIVLGSDIVYDTQSIPSLVGTLCDLFKSYSNLQALIAATVRNPETLDVFLAACAANKFVVEEVPFDCPPIESQFGFFHSTYPPIVILRLNPPANIVELFGL